MESSRKNKFFDAAIEAFKPSGLSHLHGAVDQTDTLGSFRSRQNGRLRTRIQQGLAYYFPYTYLQINGTYILKSGTDFRQFSLLTLDFSQNPVEVEIEEVNVTSEFEPDNELNTLLEKYTGKWKVRKWYRRHRGLQTAL